MNTKAIVTSSDQIGTDKYSCGKNIETRVSQTNRLITDINTYT